MYINRNEKPLLSYIGMNKTTTNKSYNYNLKKRERGRISKKRT